MGISVEAEDILSIDIKYREKNDTTDGYAVVRLRDNKPSIFHFMFSMSNDDFYKQVSTLSATSKKAGFQLDMNQKSSFILSLEKMMVGALAGTEYQSFGCPSCRMIDAFISPGRYLVQ